MTIWSYRPNAKKYDYIKVQITFAQVLNTKKTPPNHFFKMVKILLEFDNISLRFAL